MATPSPGSKHAQQAFHAKEALRTGRPSLLRSRTYSGNRNEAYYANRRDSLGMSMETKEIEAVGKSLSKIASRQGGKVAGSLSNQQAQQFWRGPARSLIAGEAAKRGPASGKKGKAVWTKHASGKHYIYLGKHGIFRQKQAIQAAAFKSGTGSYFSLGGKRTKFGDYVGVVGKFATFGVRRRPGGKSVKVAPYPWLIDAINASGGKVGDAYVRLIEEAIQTEIDKGVRKAT